jgi:sugar/nucleoside kinase (ribokinase family)
MSLLVTGSIGIDTVITPHGRAENVLGGSAVYFSFAAVQYVPVRLVAVVGGDFPAEFRQMLAKRRIDLAGLETRPGSQTFRWTGQFEGDMNAADTLDVQLNVLAEEAPRVPTSFADSGVVFLANTHPTLQREVLSQVESPKIIVCDTMDIWIANERASLLETLRVVTGVILNDGEARQLTGRTNLIDAGDAILEFGPRFVMIKKGEHGALLVTPEGPASLPAFPTKRVRDPTGAGDSFAGGALGYLCAKGEADSDTLRRSMVHGTVAASFAIEDFSVARVQNLSRKEMDQRVGRFETMLRFD